MNATHNRTGQRLTVITTTENGRDLLVANRNGVRFTVPATLVTIHKGL